MHACATGVVKVGIGPRQRRPHTGPARMNEAEQRQSRVGTIGLENPYRFPFRAVRLAVVPNHRAHLVTPARQCPAEQGLLDPFTGDIVLFVFGRQDRQILEPYEADFHRQDRSSARRRHSAEIRPRSDPFGSWVGLSADGRISAARAAARSTLSGPYVQPFLRAVDSAEGMQYLRVERGAT